MIQEVWKKTDAELEKILLDPGFDIEKVRADFPYLDLEPPVIYLDNAATTQRPRAVIDRLSHFYAYENANPLRGNHRLSLLATEAYEKARVHVKEFIHASSEKEILFTRNATESLNLVAYIWALNYLKPGDEILITRMEHHSDTVDWQFAAQRSGAKLVYAELDDDESLDMADFESKLNSNTRVVAFTGASNVLGSILPAEEIIRKAHAVGAIAVMDGAQYVPHEITDVQALDCDFLAFSGHKMLAPFGIGVLYGKKDLLEKMPPFLYGGEMIEYVEDQQSTFAPLPYKFEAGTMNIGDAVGLDAALEYLESIGMEKIAPYEVALAEYCARRMRRRNDVTVYRSEKAPRGAAVAFNIHEIHPHDVSTIMDSAGVAIRSGHHCTQPLHRGLCISASCRASFAFYNTKDEVDRLLDAVTLVRKTMGFDTDLEA